MAARDIMPYRTTDGSQQHTASYALNAAQTFLAGEPVILEGTGHLSIAVTDPAVIVGIAAHRSTDVNGTSYLTDTYVTVYGVDSTQLYKCRNIATDGSGTAVEPGKSRIGELAGLVLNGSDWFVDTGANNLICEIVEVRDSVGNLIGDVTLVNSTGTWTIVRFL